jgi:hypothetical protein
MLSSTVLAKRGVCEWRERTDGQESERGDECHSGHAAESSAGTPQTRRSAAGVTPQRHRRVHALGSLAVRTMEPLIVDYVLQSASVALVDGSLAVDQATTHSGVVDGHGEQGLSSACEYVERARSTYRRRSPSVACHASLSRLHARPAWRAACAAPPACLQRGAASAPAGRRCRAAHVRARARCSGPRAVATRGRGKSCTRPANVRLALGRRDSGNHPREAGASVHSDDDWWCSPSSLRCFLLTRTSSRAWHWWS